MKRLLKTRKRWLLLALALTLPLLPACSTLSYYGQSIGGHLSIVSRAEPIDAVLAREDLSAERRRHLALAAEVRRFATDRMGLPANGSYTSFADLERPYAVWNVVAAPPFSVRAKRWCFLFVGCLAYKGYFDEADARAEAARLRGQGFDVQVSGALAYSTLGWFDDPLLNTFIDRSEAQVVNIIVHELAHQQLYVKGSSAFNEAFATAVAREGVRRWFVDRGDPGRYEEYLRAEERTREFHQLLIATRERLAALYAEALQADEMRRRKAALFADLQAQYRIFKRRWDGYSGFDRWMAQGLNNAHLALVATYHQWVPAFSALIERHGRDMAAFYRAAADLGALPPDERNAVLDRLAAG